MGRDDDGRPDYLDRDKKSFSELDRARRDRRDGEPRRPRDAASQVREKAATREYLKEADQLFGGGRKAAAGKLADALSAARGTPGLDDACRAYRAQLGLPTETREISCFLDCTDPELVGAGLEAASAAHAAGALELTSGLRSQLRMLVDAADDAVAGAAEDLLEEI